MAISHDMIIEQFQRVINKILFIKRKDLFEFQGVRFYPSEIHLMIVLEEKCATNATKIGEQLGITKGAVSQTLSRLEKKGVLTKTKDPHNKNELTLNFTKLGTKVVKFYQRRVSDMHKRQVRHLSKNTNKENIAIHKFLLECEDALNESE